MLLTTVGCSWPSYMTPCSSASCAGACIYVWAFNNIKAEAILKKQDKLKRKGWKGADQA